MVDLGLFAESYSIGSRNVERFWRRSVGRKDVDFLFVENRGKPRRLDTFPKDALVDRASVARQARLYVESLARAGQLAPHVLRGAMMGVRVFS